MPFQVLMPQLGESVVEGTVSKWLKDIGDEIKEYEPLLEVNTDKVDSEIPSPAGGKILAILVKEGSTVEAGTLLAWIGEEGEEIPDEGEITSDPERLRTPDTSMDEMAHAQSSASITQVGRNRELGFISPIVAKISQEEGVDLTRVKGTGQGGRITKNDVLNYLKIHGSIRTGQGIEPIDTTSKTYLSRTQEPVKEILPGELLPHSIVRRTIAEHMVRSKQTSPHVTTVMEADLKEVIAHRENNKASFSKDGANLTFTAYFISAAVAGLKSFPIVNSSWTNDGILIKKDINIGMATSLGEEGLIVPVIKNADRLSLLGLAKMINDLAQRAREHNLLPNEVQGGTFTITNHGTSGSLFAAPIINQPQVAILGIGVIEKRVVVIDDAIAIRPMVYLSLTIDHRVLDGAIADYFLAKVVESLQNWN
jgi:2-oxoglutarate dehydrogenase E2 component (dihydrolipoamide succinyltransferase)